MTPAQLVLANETQKNINEMQNVLVKLVHPKNKFELEIQLNDCSNTKLIFRKETIITALRADIEALKRGQESLGLDYSMEES